MIMLMVVVAFLLEMITFADFILSYHRQTGQLTNTAHRHYDNTLRRGGKMRQQMRFGVWTGRLGLAGSTYLTTKFVPGNKEMRFSLLL